MISIVCAIAAAMLAVAQAEALPVLPVDVAPVGTWPAPQAKGLYYGDIRAVINVTVASTTKSVSSQVFWRRRDPNPEVKGIIVTDAQSKLQAITNAPIVQSTCGVVSFAPSSGPGLYYVYFLPHYQTGSNAHLYFHWYNCTQEDRECVMATRNMTLSTVPSADMCDTVTPSAGATAIRLEGRDSFHGFSSMELVASASETASFVASYPDQPFIAIAESRHNPVRMLGANGQLPALWALRQGNVSVLNNATALVGEFWTFQIGIFASSGEVINVAATVSDFTPMSSASTDAGSTVIPSSAVTCFNLEGVNITGLPFSKNYSVSAGTVGSLWFGLQLPTDTTVQGPYQATVDLSSANSGGKSVRVTIPVTISQVQGGGAVADSGFGDVYSMSRLKWLDSKAGVDSNVTSPFIPVVATPASGAIAIQLLNKNLTIGAGGLPLTASTEHQVLRNGSKTNLVRTVLAAPMQLQLFGATGESLPLTVTSPSAITSSDDSGVSWHATSSATTASGSKLQVSVEGNMEFDSIGEFSMTMTAEGGDVSLGDARLLMQVQAPVAQYVVGMGSEGSATHAYTWRWQPNEPDNAIWVGRVEAGMWLKLKGAGPQWNTPNDGKDYPGIPFIPTSWGGSNATPGATGVNITTEGVSSGPGNTTVMAFSGARVLQAGESVTFLFDLALTPSHPTNMTSHWGKRYFQVGYGTPYISPQDVVAMGATVITLHQGVPGVINGSLVNPYINYPFVPDTIELMTNYTQQARALGAETKYYYTVRELSNHAVELYALLALQGEILLDADPYTIPQPGYCQDWDCHGGSVWLHEHVVSNYSACWQQGLSNGEWDAAICDTGLFRWFNYYVEGLAWAIRNAPYVSGIYYDGINFDRHAMRRIRKAADQAASSESQPVPQLDVHTGHDGSPPAVSYLPLLPYVDKMWNGEGFDFSKGPAYWLIEVSAQIHGLSGDRLGGSPGSDDMKGMVFGMTERNRPTASALWSFWDESRINTTMMIGWWTDPEYHPVTLSYNCSQPQPPYHTEILVTAYVDPGSHAIISIGSWCPSAETVNVQLDLAAMGFTGSVTATAPAISGVQPARVIPASGSGDIDIAVGDGILYIVEAA